MNHTINHSTGGILAICIFAGCASEDDVPETTEEIVSAARVQGEDVVSWNLCGAATACDDGQWNDRHRKQLDKIKKLAHEKVSVIALTEFCSSWQSDFANALSEAGYTVAMQTMTQPNGVPVGCKAGLGQQANFLAVIGKGEKSVELYYSNYAAENRGYMCIDVGDFRGCATHLENANASVRNAQRRQAKTWGEQDGKRTIIAGDFNEKGSREDPSWQQLHVESKHGCAIDWALIERAHFERRASTSRVSGETDHGGCYVRGHYRSS